MTDFLSVWVGNNRTLEGFRPLCGRENLLTLIPLSRSMRTRRSSGPANSNHFLICVKFEHSLPKMMTRQERWSTTLASGSPKGRGLVVQVAGGTLTRKSSVTPPINTKSEFAGKQGRHNFWSRACSPALFFAITHRDCRSCHRQIRSKKALSLQRRAARI